MMRAQSVIDLAASQRFAALSGDSNPLHVDPIAARRLQFGGCGAHGVHVLLRGLNLALEGHGATALAELDVNFDAPVLVGKSFELRAEWTTPDRVEIVAEAAGRIAVRATARFTDAREDRSPGIRALPTLCRDLTFEDAAKAEGAAALSLDRDLCGDMFPALATTLPQIQIAALLTTTRIVGMECPGLHSMFATLACRFGADDNAEAVAYAVKKADRRFSLITIAAAGAGMSAEFTALVRPRPVQQPDMAEVAMRVAKGRFAGKRYLVIGGGRGLGEAASKILAAGGGDVALTYASGREDAESVAANIRDWGASARAIAFDVHAPPSARPEALPDGWTPDALLYFASPLIAISPGAPWNAERFGEFCDIFVTGFARAAIAADDVFGARGLPLTFFYPSTVFLDTPPPGAAEYVAAKAAGESLCATLALARPHTRVLAPRLPRVLTDQTISAKRVTLATPLDVLAPLLTAEDGL